MNILSRSTKQMFHHLYVRLQVQQMPFCQHAPYGRYPYANTSRVLIRLLFEESKRGYLKQLHSTTFLKKGAKSSETGGKNCTSVLSSPSSLKYPGKEEDTVEKVDTIRGSSPGLSPEGEERVTSLPNHDTSRITPESVRMELKASNLFEDLAVLKGANKQTFILAVNTYLSRESLYRRGAVEFIYAGLRQMKKFNVHKDLTAYKALIQVFPEGKMIPTNVWQVEFMHYPRQQQCGIDMLEQMENNAIIPDDEFGTLLKNRFGVAAHVTRKYRRMKYWLPKFKNMNPYPVPFEMPTDSMDLALIALKRMSVDRETKYNVYKTTELEGSTCMETFIASAQSQMQQQLIDKHNSEQPLFVEGPYPVYLRHIMQKYFLLRAEPNINALMKKREMEKTEENDENLFEWANFFDNEDSQAVRPILSVHEQDDSTVLGLCITGTTSKSSAVAWIRFLQKENPNLSNTPVLFKLLSSYSEIEAIGDNRPLKKMTEG